MKTSQLRQLFIDYFKQNTKIFNESNKYVIYLIKKYSFLYDKMSIYNFVSSF